MIASLLRSGEMEMLAEAIEKRGPRVDPEIVLFPVNPKRDRNGVLRVERWCLIFHGTLPESRGNRSRRRQQASSA
jgi:hypothetical protein